MTDKLKYSSSVVTDPADLADLGHSKSAPLLSLFDNHVVAKGAWTAEIYQASPADRLASRYRIVNASLRSLVPPPSDLRTVFDTSVFWSTIWDENHPEIFQMEARQIKEQTDTPENPAEIAKLLFCLCTTIDHVPDSFDYRSLRRPIAPKEFVARCLSTIDRLVFNDEEIAPSLSGMECMFIGAKYYINNGRPRKAWLLYRRAIQFAQLAGLHLQTNRPTSLDDVAGFRRLHVWAALACGDRYLSLILGLPYAVPDSLIAPHLAYLRKFGKSDRDEEHILQICVLAGLIIDRNQEPDNMSLASTIEIDQKLQALAQQREPEWWDNRNIDDLDYEPRCKKLMAQFIFYFVRTLLHMPFMLKSAVEVKCQHSHNTAISSARNAISCYIKIRNTSLKDPTICSMVDFQVFTSAVLLVVHLLGSSTDAATAFTAEEDWHSVMGISRILHFAAQAPGGAVAAQSAAVLEQLCKYRGLNDARTGMKLGTLGCKIRVPYFGTIHVTPAKKLNDSDAAHQPSPLAGTPIGQHQQPSPVTSIDHHNVPSNIASSRMCVLPSPAPSAQILEPDASISFENILALPNGAFDSGSFGLPPDGSNEGESWGHNSRVDLHLDQGWRFDWLDMNGIQV